MANNINDPRWPPGADIDFDSVLERLFALKALHMPQHTAADLSDPLVQIMRWNAALAHNAFSRANSALKQLGVKTAVSRRALVSMLEIVNRPLRPMQPSRGKVYCALKSAPVAGVTVVAKNTKFIQPGIQDPVFSADEAVAVGASTAFSVWWYDASATVASSMVLGSTTVTFDNGDSIIFGFENLPFDALTFVIATPHSPGAKLMHEYYNKDWGTPDEVTKTVSQLTLFLDDYMHADTVGNVDMMVGSTVTVKYKGTNTVETVAVSLSGGRPVAVTTLLGQVSASTSASDYLVLATWRPIPNQAYIWYFDSDSTWTLDITKLFSTTDWWEKHSSYGYAVRFRHVTGGSLPESLKFTSVTNTSKHYAVVPITQGVLKSISIGTASATAWEHVAIATAPISEPVEDPELALEIGSDTDWFVQDDFSASGPTSKHAIFREDVDSGWGVVFGDGSIGQLPTAGSSVKLTYRTGSTQPGDLAAGTAVKALNATNYVENFVLPRATAGWEEPEASTRASVLAFRNSVLPQLALRAESVVTPPEIVAALTGGAESRATFSTEDGRLPFSRAHWSTTGAGDRQYVVAVVGDEDFVDGAVIATDLDEAQTWLNGETIGVEIIGGHGPQNTEAVVQSFAALYLTPTVVVTISETTGVQAQVETIIREFIKPHAVDSDGAYRYNWGGTFPVALLFGELWSSLSGRTNLTLSITDGVTTYNLGDSITLTEFQLPVLDPAFDPSTDITVTV